MRNPVGYAKRFMKPYSKRASVRYRTFRQRIDDRAPSWLKRRLNKALDYLDLYFIDHHIFRAVYANRHQIAPGVWRSAQPSPGQIAKLARRGLKTIVNLRGERDCGSYRLQAEACERHGIKLVELQLTSRLPPHASAIREAKRLFDEIEYPVLFHCKSGADRAGMMSALYLHLKQGEPVEKAMGQLALRFGHFRQSDTGVLDYMFARYLQARDAEPDLTLEAWLDRGYNPYDLKDEFRAKGWANVIVNRALKRE
jgi:protein tyrosine phosphatase (PTP) superfamily phosphohydrolase (DUF442 family)